MNPDNLEIVPVIHCDDKEVLTIVLAADNNYAPFAGVTIHSLLKNASPDYFYDIAILDTYISNETKNALSQIASIDDLSNIRFIDVSHIMPKDPTPEYSYFSSSAYMRLYIPFLFANHNLVAYLDCDTVVLTDISPLFKVKMHNNYIGAVHDALSTHPLCDRVTRMFKGEKLTINDYKKKHTNFKKEDMGEYINSGVLIFNIPAFRQNNFKILDDLDSYINEGYIYVDQCIINILFRGRIKYLHQRWNMLQFNSRIFKTPPEERTQGVVTSELEEAEKNPGIIHYFSIIKPWNTKEALNAEIFWQYCKETPLHKTIQQRMPKPENAQNK